MALSGEAGSAAPGAEGAAEGEEAAKRSGNRDAVVYVIYDVESRVVTRLVLDGPRR